MQYLKYKNPIKQLIKYLNPITMKKNMIFILVMLLAATLTAQTRQTPPEISAKSHQQHTMMLLGKVDLGGGVFTTNGNDIIYAFIDGECRGTANPMSEYSGLVFLSIAENTEQNKPITFMVWLDERQELLPLNESLSFEPLAAIGEYNNPFIFTLGEMVGLDETSGGSWIGEPYPNPFKDRTTVPYFLNEASEISYKIYDSRGVQAGPATQIAAVKGRQQFEINAAGLAKGVYLLVVTASNQNKMIRLVIH